MTNADSLTSDADSTKETKRMRVYVVSNGKGGSIKTTTAAELARALALHGRRVLAIDLDEQGNLSRRLGITADTPVGGDAMSVLTGETSARDAAVPSVSVRGVDVVVGGHGLTEAPMRPEVVGALREYLPTLAGEWDAVVLDTPPNLGPVTLGALAAADVVIAAVSCETEAWEQVERLEQVISARIAPRLRPGQRVHWIVPGRYDARRVLDREIVEALNESHPGQVTTPVREAVAVKDAYTARMPVSAYAPRSAAALDYADALGPIIRDERN